MDTLIAVLIAWIVAQTGLSTPLPPRFSYISQEKMVEMAFGPNGHKDAHVRALYNQSDETIYLLEDWNPNDLRGKSELLHELVHHVQKFNNVPVPCKAALEQQAYHLQFTWLREHGVEDPYAFLDINELFVVLVSTCRNAD